MLEMLSLKQLHDNVMNNQSAFYMLNGMYINNVKKINNNEYTVFFANGNMETYPASTQVKVVGS